MSSGTARGKKAALGLAAIAAAVPTLALAAEPAGADPPRTAGATLTYPCGGDTVLVNIEYKQFRPANLQPSFEVSTGFAYAGDAGRCPGTMLVRTKYKVPGASQFTYEQNTYGPADQGVRYGRSNAVIVESCHPYGRDGQPWGPTWRIEQSGLVLEHCSWDGL